MPTLSYKVDECTATEWKLGGKAGVLSCNPTQIYYPAQVKQFTYTASAESTTMQTGDRIHALPFLGVYQEVQPFSGRLTIKHDVYQLNTPLAAEYCGEKAGYHAEFSGDVGFYVTSPSSASAPALDKILMLSLKKQADTKALADLRRSMYNAPLIMAERKQTVDMLRRKGLQIATVVKHKQSVDLQRWLKTRKADKRRVARDIAEEHLTFLFGLLPLISEIDGICEALAGDSPTKITGRGRAASDTVSVVKSTNNVDEFSITVYPSALVSIQTTNKLRYSHRTSISALVTMSGAQYARTAGFNPLATVYDLVPLSFLSDFVSNLGTFIRALDPLIGVEFLTGSSTSWVENRKDILARGYSRTYSYGKGWSLIRRTNTTEGEGTSYSRYLRVERSVLADYPDPSLMWVNNMTLAKVGTIASLAIQRYLKPVKRLLAVKAFRYKGPRPRYLPPINYR